MTTVVTRHVRPDRRADYEAWLDRLLTAARQLPGYLGAEGDAIWKTHSGLEMWFAPPPGTVVPQPVRWRMALVLGTVVYVLVLVFGAIAIATIGRLPFPLRLAIIIAVEITLMTYVLLPWITRRLARWIYPTEARV